MTDVTTKTSDPEKMSGAIFLWAAHGTRGCLGVLGPQRMLSGPAGARAPLLVEGEA